jgi:hypothetical protein
MRIITKTIKNIYKQINIPTTNIMFFIFLHKLFKHFKHSEYKERTIGLYEETPSSKERKNDILPKESQKEPQRKKCIKKELLSR